MGITDYNEDLTSKWADTLSKITGLTFLSCTEDKYHSCREGESPLCRLLQEHVSGRAFCEQDCTLPLVQALKKGEPVHFKCYANLNNVAIPVYSDSAKDKKWLILGGRIITSYEDLVGYRGVAEKLGCEQSRVFDIVKGISFNKDIRQFRYAIEAVRATTLYLFQNTERYKTAEEKVAKLQTIIKVAHSISAIVDRRELYTTILNTLGVLFNVKAAILLLRDIDEERFVVEEAFGYEKEALAKAKTTWIEGLIREAVARNEVVSSTDLFDILKSGLPNGVTSLNIFPISIRGSVDGLIVILNTPISPDDEDLIRSFCRSITLSLENRLFFSRREVYARRGGAVLQALHSISSSIDSPEIFNIIIEGAAEVVGAEQGSIMLLNEENSALEVKATKGLNPAILNHVKINPGEGIAGIVLEKGMPFVVGNIENDERVSRPNRVRYKTKSFISLPLRMKDKSIGVLNLSDKTSGTDFTEGDLRLLETLALYSAVAIERRIYYQSAVNLRKISITDPLTELLNRRYFEERISEEVERSKRHKQPFSLIILDIDNFKEFNDTYGHLSGDEALRNTAHVIRRCIRIIDIAARYGGEEFAIILPTTDKEDAQLIGNRIRDGIENMSLPIKGSGKEARLTVSLGIASYPVDAPTIEELINNADRALYKAKGHGKNRVVLFGNF